MPVVGTLTCLLFVGACASPTHRSGGAAPAGSPEQTASAPTTGTPASSAPSSPSAPPVPSGDAASTALVLGPNGLGPLKLGMPRQQATATGLLRPLTDFVGDCTTTQLKSAPTDEGYVNLSRALGIATIDAYGSIKTPEGAGVGMSSADMLRVYPGWSAADGDATNGRGVVKAPGNNKAVYRIETVKGTVAQLTLQYANQDCYE
ncbi:hypothetical protein [Micromonospora sp. NPDC049175]|uniref:hypothetical protein n=1 Tax=unclassified Micromonospora TaxID=2617518 RepID=UPI00371F8379